MVSFGRLESRILVRTDKIEQTHLDKTYKTKDSFVNSDKNVISSERNNLTNPLLSQYSPKLLLKIYNNESFVKSLIKKNPQIKKILKSVGIENIEITTNNLSSITNTHLITTTLFANKIANELGLSTADKKALEQASIFHDFGKILIPPKIINKRGKLNPKEREIINTHSEIGAELLESAGMNKRITNIIRHHHKPKHENILCNILAVADIYSALREERCYKKSMSKKSAIEIIEIKAKNGELDKKIVEALKKAIK